MNLMKPKTYQLSFGVVAYLILTAMCCTAQSGSLQVPMNVDAKKLAPNFVGHDAVQIYKGTFGHSVSKGKYETTPQYETRKRKAWMKPLFGKVYMWSPIAFDLPSNWCDYNADTKKFRAHFMLIKTAQVSGNNYNSSKEVLNGITAGWLENRGSYNAQNAFGAKVRVDTIVKERYGFQVTNWKNFPFVQFRDGDYRVTCDLKVAPAAARRLENDIRVLYVGYLTTPYRAQNAYYSPATYDSPSSDTFSYHFVCFRLKSIWFYDGVTGFIYGKMSPQPEKKQLDNH